ncbi:P-loop containing nucleoside triphosphate hydrolase protein [Flammula alnicola]|nr:P-loop containing nucleoside triphosphate hydrolase protein [Flammula alnicola]
MARARFSSVLRRRRLMSPSPSRAPKPKFNSSLHQFLTSYINLDEHDAQASALQQEAKEEAEIRERIQRFRTEGRFIPGTDVLFGTESHIPPYTSPKRTTKDIWDDIVEAVIARAKTRPKKSVGRQIAAQIASKVQAYFDAQQSKKIKAKEAEERRLRNLAKSTMKLVIAEWKKAVYHIREKQRLELEAEERRLVGQILETQQGDLSRGDLYGSRSRSGSIGDFGDEEDNDEEDEDEEDVSDEEEEEEAGEEVDDEDLEHRTSTSLHSGHDEEDEDAEDGGESTSALLGNLLTRSHSSPPTRSETPEAIPSEGREEDDPEASTTHLLNGNSTLDDLVMYSDSSSEADLGDLMHPDPETEEETEAQPPSFSASFEVEETAELSVETRTTSRSRSTSPAADVGLSRSRSRSREVRFSVPNSSDMEDERAVENPMISTKARVRLREGGRAAESRPQEKEVTDIESQIPDYLKPTPPLLLRGVLRPYQQSGLEWLASLHINRLNGILADEMGLGKTIQTIALLAHLACDRGIWGPHLIVVPTSVLLNWEMEFKNYHGTTKRRKELRQGWNDKHHFNVCITSYTLASRDAHIFKRKAWYYMILDEAHMIKNFKSQRWNILLMFRSYRRLLLTGTPLQNNLTELWALLQFLMSGANFANLKEFGEWFSNPLEKAIEMGTALNDDTMQTVSKLHTVLRPYCSELPSKFEHLTMCPLSKRQRFLYDDLDVVGLSFIDRQNVSLLTAVETRRLDATTKLPYFSETAGEPPPKDTRTISAGTIARWAHVGYLNRLRCSRIPIYSEEALSVVRRMSSSIVPFSDINPRIDYLERVDRVNQGVKSYTTRAQEMASLVDRFAFITPPVVAWDLPHIALSGYEDEILQQPLDFDELQIAFPDPSLLQYDCGKLQKLANLLREKKAGGHRILIFTQMTRILDILETFLNFHGYLYLRLDGATKIEDRQYITERFNADPRIFCFIASSRSGGVGINLTGADTVIFYDSDFNPQMDRQCEDRAHRIGQIRDVHIYRFVSQYTVEEAMLRKANQKRSLDDLALGDFEDAEDRHAAAVAAREEISLVGADEADFGGGDAEAGPETGGGPGLSTPADDLGDVDLAGGEVDEGGAEDEDQDEQGGSVVEYMLRFVEEDYDYFREWRL